MGNLCFSCIVYFGIITHLLYFLIHSRICSCLLIRQSEIGIRQYFFSYFAPPWGVFVAAAETTGGGVLNGVFFAVL
jgi:hypothetical protein